MNVCKGTCERYRVKKGQRGSYYDQGSKHCPACELFIDWSGATCPCCHVKLRTKPRNVST